MKLLVLMINTKSQPCLLVLFQGNYFHCKSCTKERLRGAFLPRCSTIILIYGTCQVIRPIKKPHFDTSRMSFYHTFKMCARNHLLLIRLWSLISLKVTCVTVCSLSLKGTKSCRYKSQTTALTCSSHSTGVSTNIKDKLQSKFSEWLQPRSQQATRSWWCRWTCRRVFWKQIQS